VRGTAPGNYRFQSLILGITQSTPFQMRKSPKEPMPVATSARAGR